MAKSPGLAIEVFPAVHHTLALFWKGRCTAAEYGFLLMAQSLMGHLSIISGLVRLGLPVHPPHDQISGPGCVLTLNDGSVYTGTWSKHQLLTGSYRNADDSLAYTGPFEGLKPSAASRILTTATNTIQATKGERIKLCIETNDLEAGVSGMGTRRSLVTVDRGQSVVEV